MCDIGIAGDEAAIAVVGPLTVDHADAVFAALGEALGEDVARIDIDLVPCDVVDLVGAHVLALAVAQCRRAGVSCRVVGADRFVRHLLDGLDLDVPLD